MSSTAQLALALYPHLHGKGRLTRAGMLRLRGGRRHPAHRLADELWGRADVQPREPRALNAEVSARAERHPAALEEGGGRIVAQAEVPAVQPGKERGRTWNVSDAWQLLSEQPGEQPAILVDLRDRGIEPRQ